MGAILYSGDTQARLQTLLELFPDLSRSIHKKAGHLSGGQQRMLALARVLVPEPRILILDEPTAGLSPAYADLVWERCTEIGATGVGLLVIEQNVKAAAAWADRAFVLASGRVVAEGVPSELGGAHALASQLIG
jgi:branched-chain amino acid transport system ATP-binding protein